MLAMVAALYGSGLTLALIVGVLVHVYGFQVVDFMHWYWVAAFAIITFGISYPLIRWGDNDKRTN